MTRMFSFQLFRFEVIGELSGLNKSDVLAALVNGFQLFRFEVIGELFMGDVMRRVQ